jgi:tRNA(Ile)-lysidine synthase
MVSSRTDSAGKIVNNPDGLFGSKLLLPLIHQLPETPRYWIGFSGGADSTALLLAMHRCRDHLSAPIHAVHFHHGLNPGADSWLEHCRRFCQTRDIPFSSQTLDIRPVGGTSTEEESRNRRYQAIRELLGCEETYLTAHHADDQAETLFLNLMRGSGVEGLAGIPELRKLGNGRVARPLLGWRRAELEAYLLRHKVAWLDDPSNMDESFDRNYLRHNLFPILDSRWPGLAKRLTRSARMARQTSDTLAEFINSHCGDLLNDRHRMPLEPLVQLERPMQALVIRQWLRRQEIGTLPEVRIHEFLSQLAAGGENSRAEVRWGPWQLKLYRQFIWLQDISKLTACGRLVWTVGMDLELGDFPGRLQLQGPPVEIPAGWEVDSRREGGKIRWRAQGKRQAMKELLRRSGFPPWMRASIPVLYWDGEAVAIGDWVIADRMKSWLELNHLEYRWRPYDSLLAELRSACHDLTVDPSQPLG